MREWLLVGTVTIMMICGVLFIVTVRVVVLVLRTSSIHSIMRFSNVGLPSPRIRTRFAPAGAERILDLSLMMRLMVLTLTPHLSATTITLPALSPLSSHFRPLASFCCFAAAGATGTAITRAGGPRAAAGGCSRRGGRALTGGRRWL